MKQADEVRRDLRNLRRLTHSIDSALEVKERQEKRMAYLCEIGNAEALSEAKKIKEHIDSLRIDERIVRASRLESRYLTAIGKLDELDRTIILEGYMLGKPYWKIGKEIGYSERGVQERMRVIVDKLAKMI